MSESNPSDQGAVEEIRSTLAIVESEADDIQAARDRAESEVEALRLELAETRSKLAAADRAGEASRNECDRLREAMLEIGRAAGQPADVVPSMVRVVVDSLRNRKAVEGRIAAIVREHVVRTAEPEPALEGLLRIERSLVDTSRQRDKNAAAAKQAERKLARANDQIGRMKLIAKPASKAKSRGKATGQVVIGSSWRHRRTRRIAVVVRGDRGPGWVSYRYDAMSGYKTLTATVTSGRFRNTFEQAGAPPAKAKRKGGR